MIEPVRGKHVAIAIELGDETMKRMRVIPVQAGEATGL
jgi:hypothetical protein